jgi:hypothetical protein
VWPLAALLWLAGGTALLLFGHIPAEAPVIPEEAHALYLNLPSPVWTARLQALSLLLALLASGGLARALVPPKASGHARALAMALGTAVPALLLHPLMASALGPQPLFPAWALALPAGLCLFREPGPARTVLRGCSGLLAGLALSLDAATLPVVAPTAIWVLATGLKSPGKAGMGILVWAIGLGAGLTPVFLGMAPFAPGLEFTEGLPGLTALPAMLVDRLTWWSLPFLLLALLAGGLQLQAVLLGWMLPVVLLQVCFAATRADLLDETRFFTLLPPAWLVAYGGFRFLKGIEQGVRNVNAKKAKRLLPAATALVLTAYTAWILFLFL